MPILTVGQRLPLQLNLQVVKAFVYQHDVYYIFVCVKEGTPLNHLKDTVWGVLSVDGTHTNVPEEAVKRASELVGKINFGNLE